MRLTAFTDGAARGNPGDAGIGIVIKDDRGAVIQTLKKYIGKATNNVAEYTALVTLLEFLRTNETLQCTELVVLTDSELMARQINGEYKVKDPGLKLLYQKVKLLLQPVSFTFSILHVPRSQNSEADALANEAIDTKAS
ncbi:MAG: ribonuclease HI family protein [Ignavibacteriales bacterium]|nr:ribonuclease HI family protein [Ignavibacteriales bacterium]